MCTPITTSHTPATWLELSSALSLHKEVWTPKSKCIKSKAHTERWNWVRNSVKEVISEQVVKPWPGLWATWMQRYRMTLMGKQGSSHSNKLPQALRGFCMPSQRHEHAGRTASCSEDERPGAGSDFYIPPTELLFQCPPRLGHGNHFVTSPQANTERCVPRSSENPPPLSSCHLSFSTLVNTLFYKAGHLLKAWGQFRFRH